MGKNNMRDYEVRFTLKKNREEDKELYDGIEKIMRLYKINENVAGRMMAAMGWEHHFKKLVGKEL